MGPSRVLGQGRTQPRLQQPFLQLRLLILIQLLHRKKQLQLLTLQQLPRQRLLPLQLPPRPQPRKPPPILKPPPPRLQQPLRRLPPALPPPLPFLSQNLTLGRDIL